MYVIYGPGDYLRRPKARRVQELLENYGNWNQIVRRQKYQEMSIGKQQNLREEQAAVFRLEVETMMEEAEILTVNIEALPTPMRQIIKERFWREKSRRELAEEWGISEGSAQRRIRQSVDLLVRMVELSFWESPEEKRAREAGRMDVCTDTKIDRCAVGAYDRRKGESSEAAGMAEGEEDGTDQKRQPGIESYFGRCKCQ